MENFIIIIAVAVAVLNIILFFKIWGMTNNISEINDNIKRMVLNKASDTKESNPVKQVERIAGKTIHEMYSNNQ